MYQVGEKVVYGSHGVCTIAELEIKSIDRQKVQYYVLEPMEQPGARYYVPTEKPAAVAKLSPLLSRHELDHILLDRTIPDGTWIKDENQRKQYYRDLIGSSNRVAILAMIRALRAHKSEQLAQGRKFHLCDENFLRDAEKLLCFEVAVVLDLPLSDAAQYMEKYL